MPLPPDARPRLIDFLAENLKGYPESHAQHKFRLEGMYLDMLSQYGFILLNKEQTVSGEEKRFTL
jgi:hypothetical protein